MLFFVFSAITTGSAIVCTADAAPDVPDEKEKLDALKKKVEALGELTPRQVDERFRDLSRDFHPDLFPAGPLRDLANQAQAALSSARVEFQQRPLVGDLPLKTLTAPAFEILWPKAKPTPGPSRLKAVFDAYEELAPEFRTIDQALNVAKNVLGVSATLTPKEEEELRAFAESNRIKHATRATLFRAVRDRVHAARGEDPLEVLEAEANVWARACERDTGNFRKEWAQDVRRYRDRVVARTDDFSRRMRASRKRGASYEEIRSEDATLTTHDVADDLAHRAARRNFASEEGARISTDSAFAATLSNEDLATLLVMGGESVVGAFAGDRISLDLKKRLVLAMLEVTKPGTMREAEVRKMGYAMGRSPEAFAPAIEAAAAEIHRDQLAQFTELVLGGWERPSAPNRPGPEPIERVRAALAKASKRFPESTLGKLSQLPRSILEAFKRVCGHSTEAPK